MPTPPEGNTERSGVAAATDVLQGTRKLLLWM